MGLVSLSLSNNASNVYCWSSNVGVAVVMSSLLQDVTPEDFEYDMSLIFKNCERYNGPKKNIHMLNLGKHTSKLFR